MQAKRSKNFIDLTGRIFGKLKVLALSDKKSGQHTMWDCVCKCGRITTPSYSNLVYNGVKSCRKCSNKITFKKYEEIPNEFFYRIKKNASVRKLEFNITIECIWNLFLKQNKKCAISGIDISIGSGRDYDDTRTASLDRIDSSKGYTADNIQWIHKKINRMKMDLSDEEFIEFCHIISKFQTHKTTIDIQES